MIFRVGLQKSTLFAIAFVFTLSSAMSTFISHQASALSASDWNPGYIIADQVFTNDDSMSYDNIQSFLNSKVPNCDTNGTQTSEYGGGTRAQWGAAKYGQSTFTCLKNYSEGGRSAAQIIYDVSHQYDINPQVLIVLLQKEQGLVTDTWPLNLQYRSATGYGCPDTAACDSQYYGLTNQLTWSAKMFRAIMNNSPTWYTPYVLGNNTIRYNPTASCGSTTVTIANRATQALYNYTPYQPNAATVAWKLGNGASVSSASPGCGAFGNINFFTYFASWFGSSRGDYCSTSINSTSTGVTFGKLTGKQDSGIFNIYSGSSTGCIEAHVWNTGFGSWLGHIATNSSSINTADSEIEYADLNGDGKDEAILIGLRNTGSGMIEFHVWNDGLKSWSDHYITNAPAINPEISQVSFADLNGDGKDEAILAGVANGSTSTGNIEIHVWNAGFQSWKEHIVTNSSTLDPAVSQLAFADLDGSGKDTGIVMGIANGSTSTGNIEMHIWNQGFQSWKQHIVTNSSTINTAVSQVSFADLDGDGKDEGVLVGTGKAGSGSGNIEMHVWNQGFGSWKEHIVSNQSAN